MPVRPHQVYEPVFDDLLDFVSSFVQSPGALEVCNNIHENEESLDQLLENTKDIFGGVISELGTINSPLAVRSLFVATYILMIKNKKDVRKCAFLAFWFDVFTYRSTGWQGFLS